MNQHSNQQIQNKRSKKSTLLGFLILALQIGMLFAYGFAGRFWFSSSFVAYQSLMLPVYFYMGIFAVGLGLMLSFYGKGVALGLGTAIFAIALSIQLSPLLQKFWFDVFLGHFGNTTSLGYPDVTIQNFEMNNVYLSQFYFRNSMALTISFLIGSLATIGRTSFFELFISLVVYNIMWPIPYFANLRILYTSYTPRTVFDDFGLTYVYTFAGFFGITYSMFLNRKHDLNNVNSTPSKSSTILAILGTTLVFCTIPSTIPLPPASTSFPTTRFNIGVLNVFFSCIAGVIFCITFSLLFGKTRNLNITSVIISVLSGPAIVSQFAGIQPNIATYLTVGAFGGILAAFWTQIISPKINRGYIGDALSLIGGVTLPSFFGGVVVTPILYRIQIDLGRSTMVGVLNNNDTIGNQYSFYFIAVGAAIVCGIIAGLLSFCTRSSKNDFTNWSMFSPDYGLCNNPVGRIQQQKNQSAQNFKRGQQ